MSWTNDIVFEFIDLYRRERILWDPKHPQNRNRGEVSEAWMRIQSCLNINISIDDLKKKKESLMTAFRLHWHRKKKNPNYCPRWFAYAQMENFLNDKYECDSTNELENEFFNNTETYQHSQVNTDPISCLNSSAPEKKNIIIKQPRLKTCSNKNCHRNKPVESKIHSKVVEDNQNKIFDEYELYGQLLAKKLRKLDEHHRDVSMHEIDNIMFRAKMQSASSNRRYSLSTSPEPRKMKSPIFIVTQQNHAQYEDENISYTTEHIEPQPSS